ncbi:TonB-dependent receptor [Bordetella sp. BOR01]|uniref:TonB-dependent receptor n=1 Tax=Bordetella sp. BOR01 TaxID=2854779 RepID=UPI001C490023|nr:TonB-dependent receptor [Bordetella sp. BOR01]MBV7486273.1 TonB-dependent receptor [Bordetella sp. BOR01]
MLRQRTGCRPARLASNVSWLTRFRTREFRANAMTVACAAALTLIGTPESAVAQSPRQAVTSRQLQLSLPAQPLALTIDALARQSGVGIGLDASLATGKNAPALQGSMTLGQALDRVLSGSGLTAAANGSGVSIRRENDSVSTLEAVTVTAVTSPWELPPPYAGGQVARGGRVGLLGDLDFMDTPFNQTSYTAQLIENQQAQMIADVLVGDPSVRDSGRKYGQASNAFFIRGLPFATIDASFNGLRGVFPNYRQPVEALERIEVLKGPNALLNGMGTSIAGDINLVPKRAGPEPLTRLNVGYMSDSEYGTHLDLGRRFGQDDAWGVRVNAVYRDGDTPIDEQSGRLAMGAVGLDYQGEKLRMSLDLIHQDIKLDNVSPFSFTFATPDIPSPPPSDSAILLGGKADHEETTAAFRAEYDFSDAVSAYVAAGHLKSRSDTVNTQVANIMPDGSYQGTLSTDAYGLDNTNIQVGANVNFATGPVQHKVAISADRYHQRSFMRSSGRSANGPTMPGNIYEPMEGQLPAVPTSGRWVSNGTVDRESIAVADTLSFIEDRVNLIVGVRKQYVEQEGAVRGGTVHYKDDAWTPMVGLVVKPRHDLSLYANYVQGLLQGSTVRDVSSPDNGKMFPPYKAEQYEVGIKKDFGEFATTVSLFQIEQPTQLVDPITREYSQDGQQRNRGIEWNMFGDLTPQLSVLGGISYVRAELTKTAGGLNEGHQAPGIPKLQANLGIEWHVPAVTGLTLGARVIRTGAAYLDAANTQRISGWTRYDVGARYATRIGGKEVTFRGTVENVFNKNYWIGVNGGAVLSAPRTFLLSASIDF